MYATLTAFDYHEPSTVKAASVLLTAPGATVLAGGCDLVPAIRRRQLEPARIVNLTRIATLRFVEADHSGLRIGALASLRQVEQLEVTRRQYPALYDGIHSIASVQVKATGTLVGNLCVATPASDIAPPLMVLGGTVHVAGVSRERVMPVVELFGGAKVSTLAPGEVVTEVKVPPPTPGEGSAFAKLTRTAADCAKLNVAAALVLRDGVCRQARIALGSVAATPVRAPEAEAVLTGAPLDRAAVARAAERVMAMVTPISDLRSTAQYRKQALGVMVTDVLNRAWERAEGGAR